MSRTPGSGWGAGPMLYQICAICGKKKAIYDPVHDAPGYLPFRCLAKNCKQRFSSDTLIRQSNKAYSDFLSQSK